MNQRCDGPSRGTIRTVSAILMLVSSLLLLSGCSGTPDQTEPSSSGDETPSASKETDPASASANQDGANQQDQSTKQPGDASGKAYKKRLKEAEDSVEEADQSGRMAARMQYQKARTLFEKGNLQKALDHVENALERDPTLERARALKDSILNILGEEGTFAGKAREQEQRLQAMIEQNEQHIRTRFNEARNLIDDQEFDKAINILETLKVRLRGAAWMESDVFQKLTRKVKNKLKEARRHSRKRSEQIQAKLREKAENRSVKEERERLLKQIRWTDRLMERAIIHFQEKRYDEAIQTTKTILSKYPTFEAAKSLKRDAEKAAANKWEQDYKRKKIDQWKNYQRRMIESRIPYNELIQYPSEEEWEWINQRAKRLGPISPASTDKEEQPLFSLKKKLENRTVNIEYVDAELDRILDGISDKHDMIYAIDQAAKKKAQQKKTVVLKNDLSLESALTLLTRRYGLKYHVKNGAVVVTTAAKLRPEMKLRIFRTRDLVYLLNNVPDFNSQKLGLSDDYGNEEDGKSLDDLSVQFAGENDLETADTKTTKTPLAPGSSSDQKGERITQTQKSDVEKQGAKKKIDLTGLIKSHVASDSWDHEGASIRQAYNGMLFVRNTPEVLAKVEKFVKDVRAFAGSMVNVSVRFLVARDDFLENLGIEFRDLSNNPPSLQRSDSPASVPGIVGEEGNAGANTNLQSGEPGVDFRFRSNFQNPDSAGQNTDPPTPNQTNLTNTGGLGAAYEIFGGQDYNMVLRALQKSERAFIVDSTHFTLFNTQRANINITQLRSFVEDIDASQAGAGGQDQAVTAFDPVIGVVRTGLVLDVRPIISFDRKYVTMQIKPSIARLVRIRTIPVIITPAGNVTIQLPQIRLRSVESTVRIPDRGALILGGLTRGESLVKEQGIPVLKNLPVVGALFSETTDVEASQELQILIHVEIINTAEREQEAFGATSASNVESDSGSSSSE